MFTGIVQGRASILSISVNKDLHTLEVKFPESALGEVCRGASIAINGCCLTVTSFNINESIACFDVMRETLRATNIGLLESGESVNFERAASIGDEIGGHLMSGHIATTVELVNRIETDTNCELQFTVPTNLKKYLLPKGFVGLNGCSLTIGQTVEGTFSVHLIPETLEVTTFSDLAAGSKINLEIDSQTQATVDTVERYLSERGL